MPTPRFLAPLKDAFKHHKSGETIEDEEPQLDTRDFATKPGAFNGAVVTSCPFLPSTSNEAAIRAPQPPPELERSATPAVPNTSTSHTDVSTLGAQTDLVSARIAHPSEQIDDEDSEEEHTVGDHQLRRLYDDEEIERFLSVFSALVTEVTLAPSAKNAKPKKAVVLRSIEEEGKDDKILAVEDDSDAETDIDEPWTYLNSSKTTSAPSTAATTLEPVQPPCPYHPPKCLSAHVAAWIIPKIPPAPITPPSTFKISAARLAGQRLYVATYPAYVPFITELMQLAAWTDWNRSARVCTAWWLLWFFNLLLPALLGKILFSLLRRRLLPHTQLSELRQRRRVAREADELSEAIETDSAGASYLGTGPAPSITATGADMGLKEMWKLGKTVAKTKVKKGKAKVKEAGDAVVDQVGLSSNTDGDAQNQSDGDWRTVLLKTLEEIADVHERVRNLFLWRREQSSRIYTFILTLLVLFTALAPARILAKVSYATIGVLYWFVVPIIMAMPPNALKRLPPPLFDVPTDAEYAISMISTRVAHGESIVPVSRRGAKQRGRARRFIANMGTDSATGGSTDVPKDGNWSIKNPDQDVESMKAEANEREAVAAQERAATAGDVTALKSEVKGWNSQDTPAGPPFKVGTLDRPESQWEASKVELPGGADDSNTSLKIITAPQTVPANHKATPGSLTLSSESICFTTLLSHNPRLRIDLEQIQGVKKTSRTNGLRIRYLNVEGDDQEVVFRFIPSRDEIFGKLVGWGGKRWQKV